MPGPDGGGVVLDEVDAGYGFRPVLRGVSLEAPRGEVTGLIGPNGSGKTTVIRVTSRGLAPRGGRVRVAGVDPYGLPPRRAARLVAVVPQDLAPAFPYTALEVVLMGRSPYLSSWGGGRSEDWAKAREAMGAADVHHLADRPIAELSGGERQRVVLAQALAQDAPVLLLDEPTTHLDIRHVLDTLGTVRTLAGRDGKAVLAVFHDLNLASAHCDRIFALSEGRVVAAGAPAQVLTPALLREVFRIEADVVANAAGRPVVLLPSATPAPVPPAGAPRAHVVPGAGRATEVFRVLGAAGFEVTAGVLHQGDGDEGAAQALNLLRVTVPPFSTIDDRSARDCRELIRGSALLVVCDVPFGPGNVANLRLALEAARSGVRTILLEQVPIEERDFTGGEATRLWRALAAQAAVVRSLDAIRDEAAASRR